MKVRVLGKHRKRTRKGDSPLSVKVTVWLNHCVCLSVYQEELAWCSRAFCELTCVRENQRLHWTRGTQDKLQSPHSTFHTHRLKCKSFITHTGDDNSSAVNTCLQVNDRLIALEDHTTQQRPKKHIEVSWRHTAPSSSYKGQQQSYRKHLNDRVAAAYLESCSLIF